MTALRRAVLALPVLFACAGAPSAADDVLQTTGGPLVLPEVTVRFNADWTHTQSGPLIAGGKVRFAYDAQRLPGCRGDFNGQPAWAITGAYQLGGGAVGSFEAGGLSPSNGSEAPVVLLQTPGDLAVWFQVTNRWGCQAWDSAYGANYHFKVLAQPALRFNADFSTRVEGDLAGADTVVVGYALERLPRCRQGYNGLPTWEILAFYRFDGGAVHSTPVTAPDGSGRVSSPAELKVPPGAQALELWFKNTDRAGCVDWDSRYGQNYRFALR